MSRFVNGLKYGPSERDGFYILSSPLYYESDLVGVVLVAPEGFETNFVTGRKLFVVRRIVQDKMNAAAVIHDLAYHTGCLPRDLADDVFHEAMLVSGVARWRAWLAWAAVRVFGHQFYHAKDEEKAA